MIELNIKGNVKAWTRQLSLIEKKQVPFALARALTWTAKDCQAAIQKEIPNRFNVTLKWWLQKQPTGIRVKPATKVKLWAEVYTEAYFARLQEEGGLKTPLRAGKLQVPLERVPKIRRKSGGAKVMLGQKKVFGTKQGVWRKVGKKKERRVELLYWKTPTAMIKPRWGYWYQAYKVGAAVFPEKFARSLASALKTAR